MSRMELLTRTPSSVSSGLRLISTGNSPPSLRKPYRSRPAPMGPDARPGNVAHAVSGMLPAKTFRHEHFHRLAEQFLAGKTEQFLRLRVDQDDVAVLVDDHHGVGGRLHQAAKLLLGPFALGDVEGNALQEQRLAVRIESHLGLAVNPHHPAVARHEAILRAERLAQGARPGELDVPALAVVGVQLHIPQDGIVQPLFLGEPQQRLDLRTDVQLVVLPVERGHEGDRRDLFHQGAVARLPPAAPAPPPAGTRSGVRFPATRRRSSA